MRASSSIETKKSLLIITIFIVANYGRTWIKWFTNFSLTDLAEKWQRLSYIYGWEIGVVLLASIFLFGKKSWDELGLASSIGKGFMLALFFTLPMFIGYAIIGQFDATGIIPITIFSSSVLPAFSEELLFRGFLFGLLFRKYGWGFIPAVALNALIFGIGHAWQGNEITDTIGIVAVTLVGGVWFAWLFVEWQYNLWLPIFLHGFMNFSWSIFTITNDNALGGLDSNTFRLCTIVLSILVTIRMARQRHNFEVNKTVLF